MENQFTYLLAPGRQKIQLINKAIAIGLLFHFLYGLSIASSWAQLNKEGDNTIGGSDYW